MNIDFYAYAQQIIGPVPPGSIWLYDVGTLLFIILVFALFLAIPIYLIVRLASR